MLADALTESLEEILGKVAAKAVICMIAELNKSSEEQAIRDPKAIHFGLMGLFGPGGRIIERMILQKLGRSLKGIDVEGDFLDEMRRLRGGLADQGGSASSFR